MIHLSKKLYQDVVKELARIAIIVLNFLQASGALNLKRIVKIAVELFFAQITLCLL